jgi:tRNA (cytidine/uridine-2'-O-)-methyltransferase
MQLALYQPDIPQNAGTILRLCACMGIKAHIIEPTGFPASDRAFRRAGMDYLDQVEIIRHIGWQDFDAFRRSEGLRLVLASTKAATRYTEFAYATSDIVLLGRESAGVPDDVHNAADARIIIPMRESLRSINVAVTAAMIMGEALRQLDAFP